MQDDVLRVHPHQHISLARSRMVRTRAEVDFLYFPNQNYVDSKLLDQSSTSSRDGRRKSISTGSLQQE